MTVGRSSVRLRRLFGPRMARWRHPSCEGAAVPLEPRPFDLVDRQFRTICSGRNALYVPGTLLGGQYIGRDVPLIEVNRSEPAIVAVGVTAAMLNDYRRLWPIFVAQLDCWPEPWHEFSITESIPPERIVAILGPSSPAWPVRDDEP